MPKKSNNTAQQVLEYLLLWAAVIVVIVAFARPIGPFRNRVEKSLNSAFNEQP